MLLNDAEISERMIEYYANYCKNIKLLAIEGKSYSKLSKFYLMWSTLYNKILKYFMQIVCCHAVVGRVPAF